MLETKFELRVPNLLLNFGYTQDDIQSRISEWIVISLFTEGLISSGKAARLLKISRIEFIALLNAKGIAYINYSDEELEEEFASVQKLTVDKSK